MKKLTGWQTIILAAGKSSRMNSKKHKSLVKICGKTLLERAVDLSTLVNDSIPVVVVGFQAEIVRGNNLDLQVIWNKDKTEGGGTAGSLLSGVDGVDKKTDNLLVLYVDDAFNYSAETMASLSKSMTEACAVLSLLTFRSKLLPMGGLTRDKNGQIMDTVDMEGAQKLNLSEIDILCGAIAVNKTWFLSVFNQLKINRKGEKGIPELISIAYNSGQKISEVKLNTKTSWQGVNTRQELARARKLFTKRK